MAALGALTAQLASRYFLDYQFAWTEEMARLLFTWIVFFGAANITRRSDLIASPLCQICCPTRRVQRSP
jgi:TRAP-type C4-dicarboxylate transport system permease small subunit